MKKFNGIIFAVMFFVVVSLACSGTTDVATSVPQMSELEFQNAVSTQVAKEIAISLTEVTVEIPKLESKFKIG